MATRCLVKICSVYRTSSFHDLLADLSVIVKDLSGIVKAYKGLRAVSTVGAP